MSSAPNLRNSKHTNQSMRRVAKRKNLTLCEKCKHRKFNSCKRWSSYPSDMQLTYCSDFR